jgi:hypothetical protein
MVPDGIPLNATEILLSAGAGSYFSAVGTGADDALTSQSAAWLVAGALELAAVVVGAASFALVEHAASEIVAAMLAAAINVRFASFSIWLPLVFASGYRGHVPPRSLRQVNISRAATDPKSGDRRLHYCRDRMGLFAVVNHPGRAVEHFLANSW